jgi:hypothetical protein
MENFWNLVLYFGDMLETYCLNMAIFPSWNMMILGQLFPQMFF